MPFYTKRDHCTKTGSGQTQGELKEKVVFPQLHHCDQRRRDYVSARGDPVERVRYEKLTPVLAPLFD
jgi:hypothetical protein